MIEARIAEQNSICLVFDTAQDKAWETQQRISAAGIKDILLHFKQADMEFGEISAVCLADVRLKPKASDFKDKSPYISELFQTYAFNVVVPIGAVATEKILGFKGASKYFGKVLESETYTGMKVIPCPNPAAAKYNPAVIELVAETIQTINKNKDFPEIIEEERREQHYFTIDTIPKFRKFLEEFKKAEVIAFDTETTGLDFNRDEILTIQFSHKETYAYLIPTNVKYGTIWQPEEWEEVQAGIVELLSNESIKLVGHNLKFDMLFVHHHFKVPIRKYNAFDTMIAHFLCDETTPHNLKDLACKFTDLGDYEFELERWKKLYCKENKIKVADFSYGLIPLDILTYYAQADADVTLRLYNRFSEWLEEEGQGEVFKMVMRFQYLFSVMESTGSPVDAEYAKQYLKELDAQIAELTPKLAALPCVLEAEALINKDKKKSAAFNFNSVNQKRVLFYDILKLRFAFFTKVKNDVKTMNLQRKENLARRLYKETHGKDYRHSERMTTKELEECFRPKASTDKRSLKVWAAETDKEEVKELIGLLTRYSELVKIRSTYVISVLARTVDGYIHPTFNVIGAKSGRVSSKNPNYQNIPAHSDEAKKVKRITKAPKGYKLIGADLSAAEMRWVTVASGDKLMAEVFNAGVDSHGAIAKDIFNLDCHPNDVKELFPNERQIAKACQFLSIYGGQGDALAATAGISVERAQEILDSYFEKYEGISNYISDTQDFIQVHGYSKSLIGRKNRHPEAIALSAKIGVGLTSFENQDLEKAMRVGVNATIQSISSDGMLMAVCNLQDQIEQDQLPIRIINVIHDAVYLLVKEEFVSEAVEILLKHLTKWPDNLVSAFTGKTIIPQIPMVADADVGDSWDSLKGFDKWIAEFEEDGDDEEE